jgi:hypothetical protein
MKKLILCTGLLLLVFPLFFTSCEKEKPLSELMIGKWDVEYITQFTYESNALASEYKEYQDAGTIILQFVTGGSGIYSNPKDDFLFSWTLNGSSLSVENLSEDTLVWELKMDGDKLVWSYKETDTENTSITYEYFFTAKRIG